MTKDPVTNRATGSLFMFLCQIINDDGRLAVKAEPVIRGRQTEYHDRLAVNHAADCLGC